MKKFLTVLLVIAVMFTFSFSSAFATIDWVGETTGKYLTQDTDFKEPTLSATNVSVGGEEGITEAYRAQLTKEAKDQLKKIKKNENVAGVTGATGNVPAVTATKFYAPEKTKAVSLYENYIESLKTVKTAKDAKDAKDRLVKSVGELDDKYATYETVFGDAVTANTTKLNLTRLAGRNQTTQADYYLPGYGFIPYNQGATEVALNAHDFIKTWLFDNDYRATDAEIASGAKALVSALVLKTTTYKDNVDKESGAIVDEIYKYTDKAAELRYGLPASDAEGVDALVKKIKAFNEKYYGLTHTDGTPEIGDNGLIAAVNAAEKSLAANYFDQYYNEVYVIPEVKKLTDADKANVVAVYKKVNALLDTYEDLWDYASITAVDNYAVDYTKRLKPAYEHFLNADVEAFNKLDSFTAYKMSGNKAYFDASEKNVAALTAKRTAYDALVSNYGYDDLGTVASPAYTTAVADEALILAAEYNKTADAGYDVKDNSKIQAYLNNATVKVTTKALGNRKIRVQAKIDTESFKYILAEMEAGSTVSYQFYHKTAAATTYKASTVKERNYITYTSKSLKKGTKYKFQCAVIIKDASGNVVATKDYKASTIGSRICR